MTERFRLVLAQSNPVVGDLAGNAAKARAAWSEARDAGADMVALPEMFITGERIGDRARKPAFCAAAMREIEDLAARCADGPAIGIGAPYALGDTLHNAYWVCEGGTVAARVLKHRLRRDAGSDEARSFDAGPICGPYRIGPLRIGSPISDDARSEDVAEAMAESGAEILLVPNGSPYRRGGFDTRLSLMVARNVETGLPVVYLNSVGGQEDEVFDGASFVLNPAGELAHQMPPFEACLRIVDFERGGEGWRAVPGEAAPHPDEREQDYRAMVTAVRDRCAAMGSAKSLLELSGGIDAAMVAAIAADALGPGNARCVRFRTDRGPDASCDAVAKVARDLGCRIDEVGIDEALRAMAGAMSHLFEDAARGAVQDGIRSRLRAASLATIAETFGEMPLVAFDGSRSAVGRIPSGGGVPGGFNPIADLYETRVIEISRWRNANHRDWMLGPAGTVIPRDLTEDLPAAGSEAEDGPPRGAALDAILERLLDRDASEDDVVALGHDREVVRTVGRLLQAGAPEFSSGLRSLRLTPRGVGRDHHSSDMDRRPYPS